MTSPAPSIGKVSLGVVADVSKFKNGLQQKLNQATSGITAQIRITADADALRQSLRAAVTQASQGVVARVRIEFIPAVAILRGILQSRVNEAARGVRADVRVNLLPSLGKALGGGGGGSPGALLAKLIKPVAALGAAGGAVQVIAGITAALSQLAPIALAAPGALLSIGAAFATIKVGMQGFGEALKSGDMSKLAPSARAAATALQGFRKEWSSVQQATQQAMFKDTEGPIKRLGGTYLPILRKGMTGVASEANLMGRNILNALTAPDVSGSVATIFENTRLSMENARGSLANLTVGFIKLGGIGSQYMPALGAAFDGMAERFNNWVNAGMADGSIKAMIDSAIEGFRDLGAIVGNIGSAIGSVFSGISAGMGGATPLSALAETTQMIADTLASPAIQSALQALGETMAVCGTVLRDVLLAALQVAGPIIEALAPFVQTLATSLGTALTGVLQTLGPPLTRIVEVLANALAPILPVIADLIVMLAQAIAPIAEALVPVIEQLGAALLPVVQQLAPIIGEIAMQLGEFLAQAILTLAPILPPLVEAIGAILTAVLPLLPPLLELASALLPLVAMVVQTIVVPALELIAWIIENVIAPVLKFLAEGLSLMAKGVAAAIKWVSDKLTEGVQWIKDKGGQVLTFFSDLPGKILSALGNLGSLLINSGKSLVDGFLNGIKGAWNTLVGWVEQGMEWLRSLWPFSPAKIGPFSGTGYVTYSGKALTTDFAKSIRNGIPQVFAASKDLMDAAAVGFNSDSITGQAAWSSDLRAAIDSPDFTGVGTEVAAALAGWSVQIDQNGMAKLVNQSNLKRDRRR